MELNVTAKIVQPDSPKYPNIKDTVYLNMKDFSQLQEFICGLSSTNPDIIAEVKVEAVIMLPYKDPNNLPEEHEDGDSE